MNLISYSWEQRKLEELGKIETGNTPATSNLEYYSDTGFLWITPTDITSNITTKTVKYLSDKGEKVARVIPANSTLCTCIASIGKNTFCPIKCAFNQQINALSPNNSNDPYFIFTDSYHWSITMKKGAGGLTFQIVNKTEFSSIKTYIPSKQEQVKIGQLFYKLDSLITLHQRKLIFLKSHRFLMSVLFCYSWEQRKVTELGKIYIGLVTTMTAHYTDEGTLLIRNSDIKDGRFEFGEKPIFLEKSFAMANESRMHQIGDVITVHTGDVGTSAVISENEDKSIGFATIVTRPNKTIIDPSYLCTFLNTERHKKWAVAISTGDGRTNYNLGDYFELVVPVPSIKEQKQIAMFIENLNNLITLHQRKQVIKEDKKNVKKTTKRVIF